MQEPTEMISYQHCENLDKGYFYIGNAKIIYKGGISMERRIAKVGMEDLFDMVVAKIDNLNAEKDEAIRLATEKVNEDFADREASLRTMLEATSEIITEPDEEIADTEEIETPTEEVIE